MPAAKRIERAQHGDAVQIISRDASGKIKVKLLERAGNNDSNRVEMKFCLVATRYDKGRAFLAIDTRLVGGEKRAITIPGSSKEEYWEIKHEDIRFFHLEDGDVVDVAFWGNRPDTFRIVWKHRQAKAG